MPSVDRRRGGFGLFLLFYQIFGGIGLNRIPPATLIITALQILLYTRVIRVPWHGMEDVCISVDKVWRKKEYRRLLIGAFEHADDWHLYYNMISFIWKGVTLERFFGSGRFFFIVSVFTSLCNLTLLALSQIASEIFDQHFYYQCAVGFSGVIFALKVLTTHYWPPNEGLILGIPVEIPAKYIVWAELILIQLLVPNVSFVGHLAGVLVGVAYIHTPLKSIMSKIWTTMASVLFATPEPYRPFRPHQSNTWGYGNNNGASNWRTYFSPYANEYQWDYADNPYPPNPTAYRSREEERQATFTTAAEEDAMLQRAIEESLRERNFDYTAEYSPDHFEEPSAPMPEPSLNLPYPPNLSSNLPHNELSSRLPYPEPSSRLPYPEPSSSLPYPEPSSNLPYPEPSSNLPYPDEPSFSSTTNSNSLYPDLDEIRQRRLRKFMK